ncbi:uncharacterized protein LOC144744896 [Ciona intestinalis]
MVYQNLILWFPDAADRRKINPYTASKYCIDKGGRLVDIVDKAMYDVVYNYCRQTIVFGSHSSAQIWLGSSYNTMTDTVTQSNGKPGYNGNWNRNSYPRRGSVHKTYTRLVLPIAPPTSTRIPHGMMNHPPHWKTIVTQLCSTNLIALGHKPEDKCSRLDAATDVAVYAFFPYGLSKLSTTQE